MINITYEEFIKGINDPSKIKQMDFYIEGYNHYRSCSISRYTDQAKVDGDMRVLHGCIECILTKDRSEAMYFYGNFNEEEKIFRFGKKGKFTLKEVWNRVVVTQLIYF